MEQRPILFPSAPSEGEQTDPDHKVNPPRSSKRTLLAGGVAGALVLCGAAVASGRGGLRSSLRTEQGHLDAIELDAERKPKEACFRPLSKYKPLDMPGAERYDDLDTVEDCQNKCILTPGCEGITFYVPHGNFVTGHNSGCHLADGNATVEDSGGDEPGRPITGLKKCPENLCYHHGQWRDPHLTEHRQDAASPQTCQEYCNSLPDCHYFSWWADGGCHVAGRDAVLRKGDENVVTGPKECPLLPTSAPTPAPTPSQVAGPGPTPTPSPVPTSAPTVPPTTPSPVPTSAPKVPTATMPSPVPTSAPKVPTATMPTPVPTSAPTVPPTKKGCREKTVRFNSHFAPYCLTDSEEWDTPLAMVPNHGETEEWTLTEEGDDGQFFVSSHAGKYLAEVDGDEVPEVRLVSGKVPAAKWSLVDAGSGQTFIKSHSGYFLTDPVNSSRPGAVELRDYADGFQKWYIHDIQGHETCFFEPTTLFCFAVASSSWIDLALLKKQKAMSAGIFDCDSAMVFSRQRVDVSGGLGNGPFFTTTFEMPDERDKIHHKDVYKRVWDLIFDDGRYKLESWVVKVEPNTVFIPTHLRARLGSSSHASTYETFYATCQKEGGEPFMTSALEILSSAAVNSMRKWNATCGSLDGDDSEEKFMAQCLKAMNVKPNNFLNKDLNLLNDPECTANPHTSSTNARILHGHDTDDQEEHTRGSSKPDCTSNSVAMHPVDTEEEWEECYTKASHKDDAMSKSMRRGIGVKGVHDDGHDHDDHDDDDHGGKGDHHDDHDHDDHDDSDDGGKGGKGDHDDDHDHDDHNDDDHGGKGGKGDDDHGGKGDHDDDHDHDDHDDDDNGGKGGKGDHDDHDHDDHNDDDHGGKGGKGDDDHGGKDDHDDDHDHDDHDDHGGKGDHDDQDRDDHGDDDHDGGKGGKGDHDDDHDHEHGHDHGGKGDHGDYEDDYQPAFAHDH